MGTRSARFLAWGLCIALAWAMDALRPRLGDSPWIPGASILALVAGLILAHLPGMRARLAGGARFVVQSGIPLAIVLIGFGLDLGGLGAQVLGPGLVVVLLAMVSAFAFSLGLGRLAGLDLRTSLLIGSGTAVCGNSAIMAVAPIVKPEDEDLGLTLGVINLLGLVMLFVLPPLAHATGLTAQEGGMLAGLTVHAVPQALATGQTFGDEAMQLATLYKLVRVALLMPVCLILALWWARRGGQAGQAAGRMPRFLWWFTAAVIVRSLGLADWGFGADSVPIWRELQAIGKFVLTAVLAGVGMGLHLPTLVRVGPRVLAVGLGAAAGMTACTTGLLFLLRFWIQRDSG
ncbi:MAG: putative sulfate exporter family transporter [Planctomycetota bacterium]